MLFDSLCSSRCLIYDKPGLLRLQEGDWLFARDKDGNGDANQDMIQVIVSKNPYVLCLLLLCSRSHDLGRELEEQRARLWKLARVLLGERTERKGEALFETWPEAKRVRPHDRAYPFGCLVQQPNLVEAPAAAFKLPEEEAEGTHHDEIKEFLNVGSTVMHDL